MSGGRTPGRNPTVDDEDILAVLDDAADPVLTTAAVAAAFPVGSGPPWSASRIFESGEPSRASESARGGWSGGVPGATAPVRTWPTTRS